MTHEESVAEAHRLLTEAGSKLVRVSGSHPFWLVECDWGTSATSDEEKTMDEPHECAAALVAQLGEPRQSPAHEGNSESAAVPPAEDPGAEGDLPADAGEYASVPSDSGGLETDASEADFTDIILEGADADPLLLEPPEPEDFAPDEIVVAEPDVAAGVAIFGDNLPMQRLLLIGAVTRHASTISPEWGPPENARLMALRNFVMGASEGRWAHDPDRDAELQEMEATSARLNAIATALREKVAFLEDATREEVEAFVVEEGWP